jgi:hypothetical protein
VDCAAQSADILLRSLQIVVGQPGMTVTVEHEADAVDAIIAAGIAAAVAVGVRQLDLLEGIQEPADIRRRNLPHKSFRKFVMCHCRSPSCWLDICDA